MDFIKFLMEKYVSQDDMDGKRWITIFPGGKGEKKDGEQRKGLRVLIDAGTGEVLAGMGGKFTGEKITDANKETEKKNDEKVRTMTDETAERGFLLKYVMRFGDFGDSAIKKMSTQRLLKKAKELREKK